MEEKNKKVANVPNLRFPGFEGEWETLQLKDIVEFKVTNSFSRDNLNYENGLAQNIHYGDIHTKFQTLFKLENEHVPFINLELDINKIQQDNYCKEGDIIFADASEDLSDVGKSIEIVSLNDKKVLAGLHTLLARPREKIFHKGFAGYLFKSDSLRTQIQKEAQGSKVLSISASRISNVKLNITSVKEQEKITILLTRIDERIQTQSKIIEGLKTNLKILRDNLISQKFRFRDVNSNHFPNWETKKLKDIAQRITTKNKEESKNVLTISAEYGLISQLEFFNKSVAAKNLTGYFLIKRNHFAYNKSYSNGYPMGAIKRLTLYDKGVVSTLYICFSFNKDIDLDFIEHYFNSGYQNYEIEKIAQEGARNHGLLNVGVSDFFNININLPSLNEQAKIGRFLKVKQNKINFEIELLNKYKSQKQYLLKKIFI